MKHYYMRQPEEYTSTEIEVVDTLDLTCESVDILDCLSLFDKKFINSVYCHVSMTERLENKKAIIMRDIFPSLDDTHCKIFSFPIPNGKVVYNGVNFYIEYKGIRYYLRIAVRNGFIFLNFGDKYISNYYKPSVYNYVYLRDIQIRGNTIDIVVCLKKQTGTTVISIDYNTETLYVNGLRYNECQSVNEYLQSVIDTLVNYNMGSDVRLADSLSPINMKEFLLAMIDVVEADNKLISDVIDAYIHLLLSNKMVYSSGFSEMLEEYEKKVGLSSYQSSMLSKYKFLKG